MFSKLVQTAVRKGTAPSTTFRFAAIAKQQQPQHMFVRCMQASSIPSSGGFDDDHFDSNNEFDKLFREMKHRTSLGTKEFIPPTRRYLECGIPEDALRFSTATFGRLLDAPFVHPNEHRVTVQVRLADLPLSDDDTNGFNEYDILRDIVGTRIDEEKQELKLVSNQFGSRIENKRHLVSMLNRVIFATQKLAKQVKEAQQQEQRQDQSDSV